MNPKPKALTEKDCIYKLGLIIDGCDERLVNRGKRC